MWTDIQLALDVPAESHAGAPMRVEIGMRNTGSDTIELALRGLEITFDLVVEHDGDVVWRKLDGENIPAIVRLEHVPPGKSLALRGSWDQRMRGGMPAPPGEYVMRGIVFTDDVNLATPARRFRVIES